MTTDNTQHEAIQQALMELYRQVKDANDEAENDFTEPLFESEIAAIDALLSPDMITALSNPVELVASQQLLSDEKIDNIVNGMSGLRDCLLDPYDALKNGCEFSSHYVDLRRFARASIAALPQEALPAQEPVAEIIECPVMGQQTVREIEGRWKFLKYGTKLCVAPQPIQQEQAGLGSALSIMQVMTGDQRRDVMLNFCWYCGCNDPKCQCWNDE